MSGLRARSFGSGKRMSNISSSPRLRLLGLQALGVVPRFRDVVVRIVGNQPHFFVGQLSDDFARHAKDERTIRKSLSLRYDGSGSDDRVLPDDGAVEHRGMDADQATVTYRAPVQYGRVTHSDVFADRHRVAPIDVDDRAILHVAAVLDRDEILIAADDRPRPYAHAVSEPDLSDHSGVRSDERRPRYLRTIFTETENGHALLLPWNMLVHDCNSACSPLLCRSDHCDCELTSASLRSGRDTYFDVTRRPPL